MTSIAAAAAAVAITAKSTPATAILQYSNIKQQHILDSHGNPHWLTTSLPGNGTCAVRMCWTYMDFNAKSTRNTTWNISMPQEQPLCSTNITIDLNIYLYIYVHVYMDLTWSYSFLVLIFEDIPEAWTNPPVVSTALHLVLQLNADDQTPISAYPLKHKKSPKAPNIRIWPWKLDEISTSTNQ